MASDSSEIDYQVTYVGTSALHRELRARLAHHHVIHRVMRTTYFDTPNYELHRRGITLRDRSTLAKNGKVGAPTTEAKIPGEIGLKRLSGAAAREAIQQQIGQAVLQPVATQTKTRQLLLAGGRRFAPQFVVALDVAESDVNGVLEQRDEVEAQIFTALPWTKQVDAGRVDRFHEFCRQLEDDFDLSPARTSGYQAIMMATLPSPTGFDQARPQHTLNEVRL